MTRTAIGRRRFLLGGATAFGTPLATRSAMAHSEYAVFTEFSPANKLMVPGWNRRIFTDTDARKGDSIKCDFATGVVTLAPGSYQVGAKKDGMTLAADRSPASVSSGGTANVRVVLKTAP